MRRLASQRPQPVITVQEVQVQFNIFKCETMFEVTVFLFLPMTIPVAFLVTKQGENKA